MDFMRIGVRAHDFGKHTPARLAQILKDAGYNAAQLVLPKAIEGIDNYRDITPDQLDEIRAAFDAADIQISVLGCYMDLSNPDDTARMEAIENVRLVLGYAKKLGAVTVASETSYDHLTAEEKAARTPAMLDSIKRIVHHAEEECVDFAIEPVEWHPLYKIEIVQEVLKAAGYSPRLRILFDAANVITPDAIAQQSAVWEAWLDAFGDRIVALHIKDFIWDEAGAYQPLPLGDGLMDYSIIEEWLTNGRAETPLLREETIHACKADDLAFLMKMVTA